MVKITALPAADTVTGLETVPIVQAGANKRTTLSRLVVPEAYFPRAGGNLFDPDSVTIGFSPWFAGGTTADPNLFCSDWFPIKPSTAYRVRSPGAPAAGRFQTRNAAKVIIQSAIDEAGGTIVTDATATEMRLGGRVMIGATNNLQTLMLFEGTTRAPDFYVPFNQRLLRSSRLTRMRRDGLLIAAAGDSQVQNGESMMRTVAMELGFDNIPFKDNIRVDINVDPANAHKNYGISGTGLTYGVNLSVAPANDNVSFCRRYQWIDKRRAEFWWGTFLNDYAWAKAHPLELGDFNQQIDAYLANPITAVDQTYDPVTDKVATAAVTGGTGVNDATVVGAAIKLVMGMEVMAPMKPKFYFGSGSVIYQYERMTTVGADPRTMNLPQFMEYLERLFGMLGARFYNPFSHGSSIQAQVPANATANIADGVHRNATGFAIEGRELVEWRVRQAA